MHDSLQDFLQHLLKNARRDNVVDEETLIEYTDTMVTRKLHAFNLCEVASSLQVEKQLLSARTLR